MKRAVPSCVAVGLLAAPLAAQLTLKPGWPVTVSGPSVDGGLVLELDGDPDLELLHVAGSNVHAWNPDGSTVSGWPRAIDNGTFSAPAAGDLDGDGEPEIVLHSFFFGIGGSLWAFHRDGTTVAGFPVAYGGTLKAPALGDLDGDGDFEIVTAQNNGGGLLYALDGDGTVLPSWPAALDDVVGTGPAIGDVDGDGVPEIFATSFVSLYGFRPDGSSLPGFPVSPGVNQTFNYATPTIADVDDDGVKEIVAASGDLFGGNGRVHVLRADGTAVAGWPRTTDYGIQAPPSVADVDGDGAFDVVAGDVTLSPFPVNKLYVWTAAGTPLAGFPTSEINAIHAQVIVFDLDGDGDLELICDDNVAVGNHVAFHHDGTPVAGFAPLTMGGAFQQSPNVADVDGDGLFELAISANDQINQLTHVYLYDTPTVAFARFAPVPTYQYRASRDGLAVPASSITPTGCGGNPAGSLVYIGGLPALGGSVDLGVDNPLGTQPAGSLALLAISTQRAATPPCGVTLPGIGMAGPYGPGELLISVSAPNPVIVLGPQVWAGAGNPSAFNVAVPPITTLGGVRVYAQGGIFDPVFGGFAVTEGFELKLGL